MIIDKNNPVYKDIPHSLHGEVLLEITKDSKGKPSGFHTIKPEYLKHFAETKNPAELKVLGFEKFMDKVNEIKGRSDIIAKVPPGLE